MTEKRAGATVIELLMVLLIGGLLVAVAFRLLSSFQKATTKGFEKIETLETARRIMERVQRDLKAICSSESCGFVPIVTPDISFSFPVFSSTGGKRKAVEEIVPADHVKYEFDPAKRILTRTITFHPSVADLSRPSRREILGNNVSDFSIAPRQMLNMRYYDIQVVCESDDASTPKSRIILRGAVRSDYESRLERHPWFVGNRRSRIDFPAF